MILLKSTCRTVAVLFGPICTIYSGSSSSFPSSSCSTFRSGMNYFWIKVWSSTSHLICSGVSFLRLIAGFGIGTTGSSSKISFGFSVFLFMGFDKLPKNETAISSFFCFGLAASPSTFFSILVGFQSLRSSFVSDWIGLNGNFLIIFFFGCC